MRRSAFFSWSMARVAARVAVRLFTWSRAVGASWCCANSRSAATSSSSVGSLMQAVNSAEEARSCSGAVPKVRPRTVLRPAPSCHQDAPCRAPAFSVKPSATVRCGVHELKHDSRGLPLARMAEHRRVATAPAALLPVHQVQRVGVFKVLVCEKNRGDSQDCGRWHLERRLVRVVGVLIGTFR